MNVVSLKGSHENRQRRSPNIDCVSPLQFLVNTDVNVRSRVSPFRASNKPSSPLVSLFHSSISLCRRFLLSLLSRFPETQCTRDTFDNGAERAFFRTDSERDRRPRDHCSTHWNAQGLDGSSGSIACPPRLPAPLNAAE